MMKLMTQLLDIESIQPSRQNNYDVSNSEIEIEALARAIVEAQVLLSIPIVKQTDLENYELISGDLEFHAYLKALEFDNNLPGRIGVYIINPREEEVARKQVGLTHQVLANRGTSTSQGKNLELMLENALKRLDVVDQKMITRENLDQSINRLDKKISNQEVLNQSIDRVLNVLNERVPITLPMFQAFDRILEPEVENQIKKNLTSILNKKTVMDVIYLLKAEKEKGGRLGSFSAIVKATTVKVTTPKGRKLMSEQKLTEISDGWE